MAIPILVLQFTNSPMVTGIARAGNIVPIVLAAILGGRAIDRFGAWNSSVSADLLSLFSVLVLPLAFIYLDDVSPLLIFLLVFFGALFDPTGVSARQTLVPNLTRLSGKSLEKVNSLRGGLENGTDFLGPLVAVALISMVGVVNAFFLNAVTFFLCVAIFAGTVPRQWEPSLSKHEDAGRLGLIFIFKQSQLKTLAIVGMIANFVMLPFLGLLLPVLAIQKFESVGLLGVCLSAFGLAATAGSFSFSWLTKTFSRSAIYYGGLIITGTSITLCALATSHYHVVACASLAGLLLGAGNPLEQTILQEQTPKAIAGQIFTSLTAVRFVAGPFGLLLAGIATEFANVEIVLLALGGLLIASAIIGWYRLPLHTDKQHEPGRT